MTTPWVIPLRNWLQSDILVSIFFHLSNRILFDSNNLDNYTFDTCTKESKTFNREYHTINYKPNEIAEYIDQYMPEKFTQSKTSLLHGETKSEPSISYVDTENGNTIYHDLVKGGSCQIIKKLLDNKTMNIEEFTSPNSRSVGIAPLAEVIEISYSPLLNSIVPNAS